MPASKQKAAHAWRGFLDARVLFVEAFVDRNGWKGLAALGEELFVRNGPKLTVVASWETLLLLFEQLGARFADCELFATPPFPEKVEPGRLAVLVKNLGVAIWSDSQGLARLGDALDFAVVAGAKTVAIMNPPAGATPLTTEERSAAREAVESRVGSALCELRVHDLFLSEELGLAPFDKYRGCAAGGTLGHVDVEGIVYGCRTLPIRLGDLGEETLASIWKNGPRRQLRARLDATPDGCGGCAVAETCKGGCRGYDHGLERDPSCPEVRA